MGFATRMLLWAWIAGCGASNLHDEPRLEVQYGAPTLAAGRVEHAVEIRVPEGHDPSECRLLLAWEGRVGGGEVGPVSPTVTDGRYASFHIPLEIESDVVRVRGRAECGRLRAGLSERFAMTDAGSARYCGLCPDRAPSTPEPPDEGSRPGLEVFGRVGVLLAAEGSLLVDRCTGRTLADTLGFGLSVVPSGGTDLESAAALLFAADLGEPVCERRVVPSSVILELGDEARSASIGADLAAIPELSVFLALPPYPG